MGDFLSKPSQPNPSSTATTTATPMTSSNSSETHQPKPESEPTHQPETPESETPIQENQAEKEALSEKDSENLNGEEEEGECGFCLFMKGGGCKETFTDWEKCVEEGEKNKEDIVEKCFQATAALRKCMEAHSDYYAPLLQAEKAAEAEAVKQLEEEKEKERLSDQESGGDVSKKNGEAEILDGSEKKEKS